MHAAKLPSECLTHRTRIQRSFGTLGWIIRRASRIVGLRKMFMCTAKKLLPPRIILFLAAVFLTTVQAQPPPGGGRASFYTESNFRGEVLTVEMSSAIEDLAPIADSRNQSLNYRFRSVRLEGPVVAVIFDHPGFRGATALLNRDIPDLSVLSLGQSGPGSWDRAIASIQVDQAPAGPPLTVWEPREAERSVRAAYRDIFSRDPDRTVVNFYTERLLNGGWSEAQLRDALRHSDEFKNRDLGAIVRRVYVEVLGRQPDPSGLATYTKALSRGQTEAEFHAELFRSREGQDYSIRMAITRAYREVLKREPDAAGLASYQRLVRDKAWDENRIKEDLKRSDEYKNLGKK